MSEPTRQTATAATDLFDKYTLPKVALAVILVASLVGTWVTATLGGGPGIALVAGKWAFFVALGVLTGGLVWQHGFVRPRDLGTGAGEYCAAMYERFDRIAAGALLVLVLAGSAVLADYAGSLGRTATVAYGTLLASSIAVTAVATARRRSVEERFRSPTGLAALGLALALVAATAAAEVSLRGFSPGATTVRTLHLLAFAVWIGGAVWNIFVAVPTGQERSTAAVVRAAGEQLERFRWAVRFIFPTLVLTGLYQAVAGLGTNPGAYVGTTVGLAVLAKVGAIALLVVIFLLCPMWRACSPIDGVCDLEDLGGTGAASGGEVTGDD